MIFILFSVCYVDAYSGIKDNASNDQFSVGQPVFWGKNDFNQTIPPEGTNYTFIEAGDYHGLALLDNGSIIAWGRNNYGQIESPHGEGFIAVAGGHENSFAIRSNNSIIQWGSNTNGDFSPPEGNDFIAITAGHYHCLALKDNGTIVGWGHLTGNDFGQATPPLENNFTGVAAGEFHSLAIRTNGSIACWGLNNRGQSTAPAGNDFIKVAGGSYHSLALRSDGTITGWGENSAGQAQSPTGNDFIDIAAGGYHSLALRSNGSVIGWGMNFDGQTNSPHGNDFVAVTAGYMFSGALRAPPEVITIQPQSGPAGSTIAINVSGNRFTHDVKDPRIKLVNGSFEITALNVEWLSPSCLSGTITIPPNTFPGNWDLVVTNPSGLSGVLPHSFEVKSQIPPVAHFIVKPISESAPMVLRFRDTSYGDPIQWDWKFGDGSSHIVITDPLKRNISHRYAKPGKYSVKLTVKNFGGVSTARKIVRVTPTIFQ